MWNPLLSVLECKRKLQMLMRACFSAFCKPSQNAQCLNFRSNCRVLYKQALRSWRNCSTEEVDETATAPEKITMETHLWFCTEELKKNLKNFNIIKKTSFETESKRWASIARTKTWRHAYIMCPSLIRLHNKKRNSVDFIYKNPTPATS